MTRSALAGTTSGSTEANAVSAGDPVELVYIGDPHRVPSDGDRGDRRGRTRKDDEMAEECIRDS
jgi:hypothetical protein